MNENEVITPEENFYRPALGEFAPSPTTGRFALDENSRNYYDKFGRNLLTYGDIVRTNDFKTLSRVFKIKKYLSLVRVCRA